jgi:hypothetical protein
MALIFGEVSIMNIKDFFNEIKSPATWKRVQYYIRYKSPGELKKDVPRQDLLPVLIVLAIAALIIAIAIILGT